MTLTRFQNGITVEGADTPLAEFPTSLSTDYALHIEDFIIDVDITEAYILSQVNGTATYGGPNGALTLATAGADNDISHLRSAQMTLALQAGKKFAFKTRFKATAGGGTIASQELVIGMTSNQTATDLVIADGSAMTADNCIAFFSPQSSAGFNAVNRASDSQTQSTGVFTLVDNTWYEAVIVYNGTDVKYYIGTPGNVTKVATLTTNIPTAVLTPAFFLKAGEAQAKSLVVDYYMVISER